MRAFHHLTFVSAALLASVLAACVASPNTSGNTSVACRPLVPAPPARPSGWSGTVFTIVMENHSRGDILGNAAAPYINGLAAQGALADGYHDSYVHPSEPNYLWMVAGENFGILDDGDPGPSNTIASQSHLADQIELAGLTWRAYEESMGAPCGLTSHGTYAAKHDPFVYFSDVNGWDGASFVPSARCTEHVVDYSQLDTDLANNALPDYVFITPNLDDDMHDGSIAQGDTWLAREVPKLLASDGYNNGGAIFLLWDEGGGTPAGDDPPFIAIAPDAVPGLVSHADYDTSSYLKTVQAMLGIDALPCDPTPAVIPTMDDLFSAPLTSPPAAAPTATLPTGPAL